MSHWNARLSINVSSTARSNKFMLGSDKGHEYSPQLKADHQNDTEIFFFQTYRSPNLTQGPRSQMFQMLVQIT